MYLLKKRVRWEIFVLVCTLRSLCFLQDHVKKDSDDNSNCYKSMMLNAIRINHGYSSEDSYIDEESNVDAAKFFKLFKDSDELL